MFNESSGYFENSKPSSKEAEQKEGVSSDKELKKTRINRQNINFFMIKIAEL